MSDIKVGETDMRKVKMEAKDKRCIVCGARMVETICKPDKGQLKHDLKRGMFPKIKVSCPNGHTRGWKHV
jgi:uncharacterized protein with PIN domain